MTDRTMTRRPWRGNWRPSPQFPVMLVPADAHVGKSRIDNAMVNAAQGTLCLFCDSDDWLMEDAVEVMLSAWRPGLDCVTALASWPRAYGGDRTGDYRRDLGLAHDRQFPALGNSWRDRLFRGAAHVGRHLAALLLALVLAARDRMQGKVVKSHRTFLINSDAAISVRSCIGRAVNPPAASESA